MEYSRTDLVSHFYFAWMESRDNLFNSCFATKDAKVKLSVYETKLEGWKHWKLNEKLNFSEIPSIIIIFNGQFLCILYSVSQRVLKLTYIFKQLREVATSSYTHVCTRSYLPHTCSYFAASSRGHHHPGLLWYLHASASYFRAPALTNNIRTV